MDRCLSISSAVPGMNYEMLMTWKTLSDFGTHFWKIGNSSSLRHTIEWTGTFFKTKNSIFIWYLCFDLSGMCWLRMHGFVNEHNGRFEQWNSWGWKIYVMWHDVIFQQPSNLMWSQYLNVLKYFINSGHFTMDERI